MAVLAFVACGIRDGEVCKMVLQTKRSPWNSTLRLSTVTNHCSSTLLAESDLQCLMDLLNSTSVTRSPGDSTALKGDERVTLLRSDSSALLVRLDDSNQKSFWIHRIDVEQPQVVDQLQEVFRWNRIPDQPLRLILPQVTLEPSMNFLSRLPCGWFCFDDRLWLAVELEDAQLLSTMILKWGTPPPRLGELIARLFPDYEFDKGSMLGPPWVVMSGKSEIAILQPLLNEAKRLACQAFTGLPGVTALESVTAKKPLRVRRRRRFNILSILQADSFRRRTAFFSCGILLLGLIAWSATNNLLGQKQIQVPIESSEPSPKVSSIGNESVEDFADLPTSQSSASHEEVDLQSFTESNRSDDSVVHHELNTPILSETLEHGTKLDDFDFPKILEENNASVEAVVHESDEELVVQEIGSFQKSIILRSARTIEKFRVDKRHLGRNAKLIVEVRVNDSAESPKVIAVELAGKEKKKVPIVFSDDDDESRLELELSSIPGRLWEVEFALWTTIDRTQGPIRVDVDIARWIAQQMLIVDQQLQQQLQLRREMRPTIPSAQRGMLGQEIRALESQKKYMADAREAWQKTQKSVESFFESHQIELSVPLADDE